MANFHESFFRKKTLKNFMEKRVFVFFVFLFVLNFVFAIGDWETINVGDDLGSLDSTDSVDIFMEPDEEEIITPVEDITFPEEEIVIQEVEEEEVIQEVEEEIDIVRDEQVVSSNRSSTGKKYTANFYIALILMFFVLVIIGIFIWLFLKGSKNKWEK